MYSYETFKDLENFDVNATTTTTLISLRNREREVLDATKNVQIVSLKFLILSGETQHYISFRK